MSGSIMNHLLIAQYEKLLGELCLEPKDEEIMGSWGRSYSSSVRTISWEPTNVRRARLRQAQKVKRRWKFGQETFKTCLERKTNDVVQL